MGIINGYPQVTGTHIF